MPIKYHPLVQKTKVELERLDKQNHVSWEEWRKFNGDFLPIHTEPKLRRRAFIFMDKVIRKLEENNHTVKFEYQRCHIEMYGQLTEINLRQKYFRKRIKDKDSNFSTNTYEKSEKLEFQVGSYARKGWLEKDSKSLEEYLEVIYNFIEKHSLRWAEFRKRQKIEEEEREAQRIIEEEKQKQIALEKEKYNNLLSDAKNHNTANLIRSYLKSYQEKLLSTCGLSEETKEYLDWANKKANELDPLT